MGGGLMQLVATGAQDIYITGNPHITFFKSVYRRYCPFGLESYEMSKFENIEYGNMDLGKECCVKVVSIEGTDLLRGAWLEVDVTNAGTNHVYGLGNALIKSVALEFNGQIIEEHTGGWLNIYGEMFQDNAKRRAWDTMVGNCVPGTLPKKLFVPLRFFFCTNNGTALPLCAMKQTAVKLKFHFATREELQLAPEAEVKIKLWGDYVYIGNEEKIRYETSESEMLIEQVQIQDANITSGYENKIKLNFRYISKCLYFSAPNQTCTSFPIHNTSQATPNPTFQLTMNGQDRVQEKGLDFFLRYMPYRYHVNNSRENMPIDICMVDSESAYKYLYDQYVYMYSFALNAGEYQPSGSANFNRIDSVQLNLRNISSLPKNNLTIYSHGYNILKIQNGLANVIFS
jgi:hypothetical protein